jgi:hypothetical protein
VIGEAVAGYSAVVWGGAVRLRHQTRRPRYLSDREKPQKWA